MKKGRFLEFGGQYAPETMMSALTELEDAYRRTSADPDFRAELATLLRDYAGRPSRLTYAEKLTRALGGAKNLLKARGFEPHGLPQDQQRSWGRFCSRKKWANRA